MTTIAYKALWEMDPENTVSTIRKMGKLSLLILFHKTKILTINEANNGEYV